MRTLFVGDVHGCSEELAELLEQAQADRIILLGDLYTKGPDPKGVWALVEAHGCEGVLGNHDAYLLKQRKAWDGMGLPEAARDWLAARPLWMAEGSWVAVHAGLHPTEGRAGTTPRIATVVRTWPRFDDPELPTWYELYTGAEFVIYGHDARRGLVDRRAERPPTLGLDSGCVYGGKLTGYLLEEDRLLQVQARRAYLPVGNPMPRDGVS